MHLTEQIDQPKPTVFPKCWTSHNNGVNVNCYCEIWGRRRERWQDVSVTAQVLF